MLLFISSHSQTVLLYVRREVVFVLLLLFFVVFLFVLRHSLMPINRMNNLICFSLLLFLRRISQLVVVVVVVFQSHSIAIRNRYTVGLSTQFSVLYLSSFVPFNCHLCLVCVVCVLHAYRCTSKHMETNNIENWPLRKMARDNKKT